jgi:hypothetical protein
VQDNWSYAQRTKTIAVCLYVCIHPMRESLGSCQYDLAYWHQWFISDWMNEFVCQLSSFLEFTIGYYKILQTNSWGIQLGCRPVHFPSSLIYRAIHHLQSHGHTSQVIILLKSLSMKAPTLLKLSVSWYQTYVSIEYRLNTNNYNYIKLCHFLKYYRYQHISVHIVSNIHVYVGTSLWSDQAN